LDLALRADADGLEKLANAQVEGFRIHVRMYSCLPRMLGRKRQQVKLNLMWPDSIFVHVEAEYLSFYFGIVRVQHRDNQGDCDERQRRHDLEGGYGDLRHA